MTPSNSLQGIGVLVTRPAHQAETLCEHIRAANGRPVRFPLLEIHATGDSPEVQRQLARLGDYRILLFVSPNAVRHGLDTISRHGGLPPGIQLAAVGRGTALELQKRAGRWPDIVPDERFESEGLLALPALQDVAGKRILIVRGNGGRELLATTLTERGAKVDYAEVYRRVPTTADSAEPQWLDKSDIITLTSSEALRHLVTLTPEQRRPELFNKPLVVVSERTAALAAQLGFMRPAWVSAQPSDEAILQAVAAWAAEASDQEN